MISRSVQGPLADDSPHRLLATGGALLTASVVLGGPVALSIALIAWGAARMVANRHRPEGNLWLATTLVVYGGIALLAVVAEYDALTRAHSLGWQLMAALDIAAACGMLGALGLWGVRSLDA